MIEDEKEIRFYTDYVYVNTVNETNGKSLNTGPQGH